MILAVLFTFLLNSATINSFVLRMERTATLHGLLIVPFNLISSVLGSRS